MDFVEDFSAKVNKCSQINEYINIFCYIVDQDHSLTFNQGLS